MKRDLPLTLFAWCFVIFVAAFLPWGSVGFFPFPLLGSQGFSVTVTGWTGGINVLGMLIPSWILVVIAASLAFIGYLRTRSVPLNPSLPHWLMVYGIFHTALFIAYTLLGRGGPNMGIGSLVTLVAFISLFRAHKKAEVTVHKVEAAPNNVGAI